MRLLTRLLTGTRREADAQRVLVPDSPSASSTNGDSAVANEVERARTFRKEGKLAEALATIDTALADRPSEAYCLEERGAILFAWGRHAEAHQALQEAAQAGIETVPDFTKLGWTLLWLGRIDAAGEAMQRAVDVDPGNWEAHFGLGTVLRTRKEFVEAIRSLERALELNADDAHCLSSLVACELQLDHFERAEQLAHRVTEVYPSKPGGFSDLGMSLCSQQRHDEAIAAFEHAESLEREGAALGDDTVNYAICLLRANRTRDALAMLERRIPHYPSAALQSHYALALLISGRLREGWEQYEFRWMDEPLLPRRPNFVKPQWDGQDLRGRTLLLWGEQGFGDFIQFMRYGVHVKALGATVLLFCRDQLRSLAEALPYVDRVLDPNEPYPAFDYWINLLSLPRVFGTELDSIPHDVPYLRLDAARVSPWRDRFANDSDVRVGLVWAGSPTHLRDRFRSLALESLAPILSVAGAVFYSLQKGPASAALQSLAATNIVDLAPDLASFADTAAAIRHLDLVIGVDTAVIHLAGALGRPVWTLLPTPADWRWLEDREDSPWYPTMRLFRQRRQGDWSEVVERVKSALKEEVLRRRAQVRAEYRDSPLPPVAHSLVAVSKEAPTNGTGYSRVAETRWGIVQYFPDDEVGRSLDFYGEHRQLQVELFERFIAPAMFVLDTDAGIGALALALARRLGNQGHLYLYESNASSRQVLQQNLKSNGVGNTTVMIRRLRTADGTGDERPQAAPSETIDDLHLKRLDCVKMSKHFIDVLNGASATLWRLRPTILIDVPGDSDPRQYARLVSDFGYASWLAHTPLFNPRNFNRRGRDIFSEAVAVSVIALPEESATGHMLAGCERLG